MPAAKPTRRTAGGLVSFILAVSVGPETKGKQLVAEFEIFEAVETP